MGLLHFVAFAILCSNSPNVVVRFRMIIGEIIIVVGSLANLCWVSQLLAACHCKQDLCCLTSGWYHHYRSHHSHHRHNSNHRHHGDHGNNGHHGSNSHHGNGGNDRHHGNNGGEAQTKMMHNGHLGVYTIWVLNLRLPTGAARRKQLCRPDSRTQNDLILQEWSWVEVGATLKICKDRGIYCSYGN